MNVMQKLRDPVWQFVGAVMSLLALIVAVWPTLKLTNGDPVITLCQYQQFSIFSHDPAPPDARERLRVIFRGKEIPVTELTVHHYCLSNRTGRVVDVGDFVQPVSFKSADGVEVIYVRSYRQESTSATAADWKHVDNKKWEMAPTVLNVDETLWFQVVFRVPDPIKARNGTDLFKWQALFKGALFKVAPPVSAESKWYNLQIRHEGLAVYLFVACGLIFSFAALLLYRQKIGAQTPTHKGVVILVVLSAISWALAEIAVDVIVNRNPDQPFVGWLFVGLLTTLAVGAIILERKKSAVSDGRDG